MSRIAYVSGKLGAGKSYNARTRHEVHWLKTATAEVRRLHASRTG